MLYGEYFRRRHDSRLMSRSRGVIRRYHRDYGLTASDVAHEHRVQRLIRLHSLEDIVHRRFLRLREPVGKRVGDFIYDGGVSFVIYRPAGFSAHDAVCENVFKELLQFYPLPRFFGFG